MNKKTANKTRINTVNETTAANKANEANKKKLLTIPPIGNYPSRQEWEIACWNKISESKELLSLFITAHERRNLVKRVAVMDRLVSGKSYREISKELWLSLQTINAIKKALSEKAYRSYQERSKKEGRKKKYSSASVSVAAKAGFAWKPRRTKYGTIPLPR